LHSKIIDISGVFLYSQAVFDEVEELQYNLKRDRENEAFAWDDEKSAGESELAKKEKIEKKSGDWVS